MLERKIMMNRFDLSELPKNARIHFVGIGGISMSGLAQVMLKNGFRVSGSDRQSSHITDKLKGMGAEVFIGHAEENVSDADLVVNTAAVHADNPELVEAKKRNIRIIDRAECLGAIMKKYKHAVGIAGTHGKTSTTSMLAHLLVFANTDPTISVGGELDLIGGNIRIGGSDIFVTEACEYTNSFLKFYPTVAVITNIEEDHLDFFSGLEEIKQSFRKFAELTGESGVVIACGDDENVKETLSGEKLNILYYGITDKFDFYADNIVYKGGFPSFDVISKGEKLCHIDLNVPGDHNIKNALAAIAVATVLAIEPEIAANGIETYKGVHRRFEKKGIFNGAVLIDDYAHHPTEIEATLKAASKFERNKIYCVFQPHTYSRTKTLWNEFLKAFDNVDELVIVDIYAAREVYDGETRSEELARQISQRGINACYLPSFEEAAKYLKENVCENDIVFTMGAGDVYKIGDMLLEDKK